jgi:hypothetical protein
MVEYPERKIPQSVFVDLHGSILEQEGEEREDGDPATPGLVETINATNAYRATNQSFHGALEEFEVPLHKHR